MLFDSTDPRTSRQRFISRTLVNIVAIAGIFILAVGVMSFLVSVFFPGVLILMVAGDVIVLLGAYWLYVIWDKRPIRVRCRECNKIILSNTPWFCVVCKKPNLNTVEFPFVHKCEHCGTEPKAYRCHNPACKAMIYLSEDLDDANYAYRLNSPDEVSEEAGRAKKVKTYQELKEDKEHEIAMAEGDVTLAKLEGRYKFFKSQLETKRKKPPLEAKRESLQEFFQSNVAASQAVREQKAANAEECKNDPTERKRRDRIVDFWVEREIAGENEESE